MDQVLTIDRDELVTLATELAELRQESVPDALLRVVRAAVTIERERRRFDRDADRAEWEPRARAYLAKFRALVADPPPLSDHSWLYDENGLPR